MSEEGLPEVMGVISGSPSACFVRQYDQRRIDGAARPVVRLVREAAADYGDPQRAGETESIGAMLAVYGGSRPRPAAFASDRRIFAAASGSLEALHLALDAFADLPGAAIRVRGDIARIEAGWRPGTTSDPVHERQ